MEILTVFYLKEGAKNEGRGEVYMRKSSSETRSLDRSQHLVENKKRPLKVGWCSQAGSRHWGRRLWTDTSMCKHTVKCAQELRFHFCELLGFCLSSSGLLDSCWFIGALRRFRFLYVKNKSTPASVWGYVNSAYGTRWWKRNALIQPSLVELFPSVFWFHFCLLNSPWVRRKAGQVNHLPW